MKRDMWTGDIWNSNSLIAWVIARSGIDTESIHPPTAGRAPGWQAGLVVARRRQAAMLPARQRYSRGLLRRRAAFRNGAA